MTTPSTKPSFFGKSARFAVFCCSQLLAFVAIFRSILSPSFSFVEEYGNSPSTFKQSGIHAGRALIATSSTPKSTSARLPTLEHLASISGNYTCPKGFKMFKNIVLPQNVTHANRKIPRVIHMTAKTRCVTSAVKRHIMQWKLPDHSLYLHDDAAVYKLFEYSTNDRYGNELVKNLTRAATCMTNGATLSDLWRYLMLYHYGGIYTDLDNSPGVNYTSDLIQPDTDSFFFVENLGTMSQYYMASSKHHPILLQILKSAVHSLHSATGNVMVNNPAHVTGPGAVKRGMIAFRHAVNAESNGYENEGIYDGALGVETESALPWYNFNHIVDDTIDKEYPSPSELSNRTVTVLGQKKMASKYIARSGLKPRAKRHAWKKMNMTHYHGDRKIFTKRNQISCQQHASRMMTLVSMNTSFYFNKRIPDLVAKYEYRWTYTDQYNDTIGDNYFDVNTDEMMIPWKKEKEDKKQKKKKKKKRGRNKKKSEAETQIEGKENNMTKVLNDHKQQEKEQHNENDTAISKIVDMVDNDSYEQNDSNEKSISANDNTTIAFDESTDIVNQTKGIDVNDSVAIVEENRAVAASNSVTIVNQNKTIDVNKNTNIMKQERDMELDESATVGNETTKIDIEETRMQL